MPLLEINRMIVAARSLKRVLVPVLPATMYLLL